MFWGEVLFLLFDLCGFFVLGLGGGGFGWWCLAWEF